MVTGKFGSIVKTPGAKYAEEHRYFQGCPTVARSRGGILYAGWYTGGTREPSPFNCNILLKSTDNGSSWSDVILAVDSVPELKIRAIDIQLWVDPQYRLWVFWTVRDDNYRDKDPRHLSVWAVICEDPDAETLTWSDPRYITPGFLRCQPVVLSDHRILLFSYDWTNEFYSYSESSDNGVSWVRKTGGRKLHTPFDEAMAVERADGSLWMLARCESGFIAQSTSIDGGKHWGNGVNTSIVAPSSRFFIRRLASGKLLLIYNRSTRKVRENMTAALSDDDGISWKWSILLDARTGVSYPDASVSGDGTIYIVHDFERTGAKEICLSRITEADIMAGRCVSDGSFAARVISKAPLEPADAAEFTRLRAMEDAWKEQARLFNQGKTDAISLQYLGKELSDPGI